MKNKLITILILSFVAQSSYAQAMKQKKVCNTLDNGAEFCTIFNVPVDDQPKKSMEEINRELEQQSELVFTDKYNQGKNVRENQKEVPMPQRNQKNQQDFDEEQQKRKPLEQSKVDKKEQKKPQKESKAKAAREEYSKPIQDKAKEKNVPVDNKLEQKKEAIVKPIKENTVTAISIEQKEEVKEISKLKEKSDTKPGVNKEEKNIDSNVATTQTSVSAPKPVSEKDKKSFSDYLKALKSLDK